MLGDQLFRCWSHKNDEKSKGGEEDDEQGEESK